MVKVVEEAHAAPWHVKEAFGTPNEPNDPLCGHSCFVGVMEPLYVILATIMMMMTLYGV